MAKSKYAKGPAMKKQFRQRTFRVKEFFTVDDFDKLKFTLNDGEIEYDIFVTFSMLWSMIYRVTSQICDGFRPFCSKEVISDIYSVEGIWSKSNNRILTYTKQNSFSSEDELSKTLIDKLTNEKLISFWRADGVITQMHISYQFIWGMYNFDKAALIKFINTLISLYEDDLKVITDDISLRSIHLRMLEYWLHANGVDVIDDLKENITYRDFINLRYEFVTAEWDLNVFKKLDDAFGIDPVSANSEFNDNLTSGSSAYSSTSLFSGVRVDKYSREVNTLERYEECKGFTGHWCDESQYFVANELGCIDKLRGVSNRAESLLSKLNIERPAVFDKLFLLTLKADATPEICEEIDYIIQDIYEYSKYPIESLIVYFNRLNLGAISSLFKIYFELVEHVIKVSMVHNNYKHLYVQSIINDYYKFGYDEDSSREISVDQLSYSKELLAYIQSGVLLMRHYNEGNLSVQFGILDGSPVLKTHLDITLLPVYYAHSVLNKFEDEHDKLYMLFNAVQKVEEIDFYVSRTILLDFCANFYEKLLDKCSEDKKKLELSEEQNKKYKELIANYKQSVKELRLQVDSLQKEKTTNINLVEKAKETLNKFSLDDKEKLNKAVAQISKLEDKLNQANIEMKQSYRLCQSLNKQNKELSETLDDRENTISMLQYKIRDISNNINTATINARVSKIPLEAFVQAIKDYKILIVGGDMIYSRMNNLGFRDIRFIEAGNQNVDKSSIRDMDILLVVTTMVDYNTSQTAINFAELCDVPVILTQSKNVDLIVFELFEHLMLGTSTKHRRSSNKEDYILV